MKKKVLRISLIIFCITFTVFFAFCLFTRLFSGPEKKMLFDMRNIVNMHITPKNYYLSDINTHYFTCGLYENNKDGEYYYLSIKTEEDFYNVLDNTYTLCSEIKKCVTNYRSTADESLKIEIWIENPSNWSMPVYPLENKICLGLNDNIPVDNALILCKEFEKIYIGGYRGYKVSFSDNFNSDSVYNFDNLKLLQFDDLKTEEDNEKAINLSHNLTDVTLITN